MDLPNAFKQKSETLCDIQLILPLFKLQIFFFKSSFLLLMIKH